MSIVQIREVFLWSSIINYGILFLWWGVFTLAHEGQYRLIRRLLGRSCNLSIEQMDNMQLAGIIFYKIAVWVFLIVPCIALYIVR